MDVDGSTVEVIHNRERQRFEAPVGSQLAVLDYRLVDDAYAITHTWVPVAHRGRGIGDRLAEAALQTAQAEGRQVIPLCSFIAAYVRRHRQYAPLLVSRGAGS